MIRIKMSDNDVLNWIILFCTFWEEELIALVVPAAVDQATLVAHTILAQACLGVLLRFDDQVDEDTAEDIPLGK